MVVVVGGGVVVAMVGMAFLNYGILVADVKNGELKRWLFLLVVRVQVVSDNGGGDSGNGGCWSL